MSGFVPPEDPPPEVAEHFQQHLVGGRRHDQCRFCRRRHEKGGTGVLPEDYLPPVPLTAVHDVIGGLSAMLRVWDLPAEPYGSVGEVMFSRIEGEACEDGPSRLDPAYLRALQSGDVTVDGVGFTCDPGAGAHCDHWTYTSYHCCKCGYDGSSLGACLS